MQSAEIKNERFSVEKNEKSLKDIVSKFGP
jgi:hypothetical protein